MSTPGERKCALLLLSLHPADRRVLLGRLPAPSARNIKALLRELDAMQVTRDLAESMLADEGLVEGLAGLTLGTSLQVEELLRLSKALPPAWFARVLVVVAGVDRGFVLALLDDRIATQVRPEVDRLAALPPKLTDALRAEAMALARMKEAA